MNTMPCPLCASLSSQPVCQAVEFVLRRRTYQLSQCVDCMHVYVDPLPSAAELEDFYAEAVPRLRAEFGMENVGASASDSPVEAEKYALLAELGLTDARGAVLDVGFGSGGFLLGMAQRGWSAEGVEFTDKIDQSFTRGLTTYLGRDALERLPDGRYDLVTLWHVLEHLRDPIASLRQLRRTLRPDGKLLIAVPSHDGLSARLFGKNWQGLTPPWHLHQFRPRTLELAVAQAGFSVQDIRAFGRQAAQILWIGSVTQIIEGLREGPLRPVSRAALRLLRKTVALASLRLVSMEQCLGRPSAIVAVAKKNPLAGIVLRDC